MILIEIRDRSPRAVFRYQYADYAEGQLISWTPSIRHATQFQSVEEANEIAELYRQYLDDPEVQVTVLE